MSTTSDNGKTEPTKEQLEKLEQKRAAFYHAKQTGSADLDDLREDFQTYAIELAIDLSGAIDGDGNPIPDTEPPKPTEGTVKDGGWGANDDPDQWMVTRMKDPPTQWKVVDAAGVNVATNFTTEENAHEYIDYHVWHEHNDNPVPPSDGGGSTTGNKDQFGIAMILPSKSGGQIQTAFKLEEKKRNYASGKPSEWSCEYTNVSGDVIQNVEVTIYEKINGFKKEADTISLKLGGPAHKDGACCWIIPDFATDGSPKRTLEYESPHPKNHGVNPKPASEIGGSLVGKWIGYKGISYLAKDGNSRHVESWIHYPVSNIDKIGDEQDKWRKYITWDTNDKKLVKFTGKLTTSRLDGIKEGDAPDFKYASVREIEAA